MNTSVVVNNQPQQQPQQQQQQGNTNATVPSTVTPHPTTGPVPGAGLMPQRTGPLTVIDISYQYEQRFAPPQLNVAQLASAMADHRRDLLSLVHQAEQAERYANMCYLIRTLVILVKGNVTREERNLFAIAHKHVLSAKRAGHRALLNSTTVSGKLGAVFRAHVEKDIADFCETLISFIRQEILRPELEGSLEHRVFFYKLIADHYRYLAEIPSRATENYARDASIWYAEAAKLAENLPTTDPIRLGLMLNYSVFHYEVLKNRQLALETAKTAFGKAIDLLDGLDEEDYKDATLVMQLMRDNIALWISHEQAGALGNP